MQDASFSHKTHRKKTNWSNATPGNSGLGIRRVDWMMVVTYKAWGTVSQQSLISHASDMCRGAWQCCKQAYFHEVSVTSASLYLCSLSVN